MNTKQGLGPGRQRRRYSPEFKAKLVEECRRPGMSLAAVALANGLNANLLRRWVVEHEALAVSVPQASTSSPSADFVALPLIAGPTPTPTADIRIEVRRGAATVTVSWPAQAASDCAAWLREWLR